MASECRIPTHEWQQRYSKRCFLDVVFGKASPTGKLPFDPPADMPSVVSQAADLPFDFDDVLFKFGFGLSLRPLICGRG